MTTSSMKKYSPLDILDMQFDFTVHIHLNAYPEKYCKNKAQNNSL